MSLRNVAIGGVLAIVSVAVVGVAVWYFAVREDAKLATEAPAIPADLVVDDAAAFEGVQAFQIISELSEAAYFVDEQLASFPLPSTAKGSTNEVEGTLYLSEDGLAFASVPPSTFTIDLMSLRSNEARRDRRVQDALETALYPTASFTVSSVSGYDPSVPDGEEQRLALTGVLDIHGVQNDVTWDVQARREANVITALATVTFRFEDFGIRAPSIAGFVSVEDEITLQIQLVAEVA